MNIPVDGLAHRYDHAQHPLEDGLQGQAHGDVMDFTVSMNIPAMDNVKVIGDAATWRIGARAGPVRTDKFFDCSGKAASGRTATDGKGIH